MTASRDCKNILHIGLALDLRDRFFREIRAGICEYALPRDPWVFRGLNRGASVVGLAKEWRIDGLIAGFESLVDAAAWSGLGKPMVQVAYRVAYPDCPRVGIDDVAVGRLACAYFMDKGFRTLAFLGSASDAYSRAREAAFRACALEKGLRCESRFGKTHDPVEDLPLGNWLASLPPGTGLLASDDRWALRASEVSRERGIDIPHDLAIVGVGDDDICAMTHPRLSSISLPGRRVGFEAAALLEAQVNGRRGSRNALLLPPERVITRASSDGVAVEDREVAAALRHIQEQACGKIDVGRVAKIAGVNRRTLEMRFRKILGRSPLEEIRRVRVERVRELLIETDLTLDQIAETAGFPNSQRMAVVFRELRGESPGTCRRAQRRSSPLHG